MPRIYADTSLFKGVFDPGFGGPGRRFFDLATRGRYTLVISSAVGDETEGSPPSVEQVYRGILPTVEFVEFHAEARQPVAASGQPD